MVIFFTRFSIFSAIFFDLVFSVLIFEYTQPIVRSCLSFRIFEFHRRFSRLSSFTFFEFHRRISKVVSPLRQLTLFAAYSPIRQFAKIRRIDFPYFSRPAGLYSPIRQFAVNLLLRPICRFTYSPICQLPIRQFANSPKSGELTFLIFQGLEASIRQFANSPLHRRLTKVPNWLTISMLCPRSSVG